MIFGRDRRIDGHVRRPDHGVIVRREFMSGAGGNLDEIFDSTSQVVLCFVVQGPDAVLQRLVDFDICKECSDVFLRHSNLPF